MRYIDIRHEPIIIQYPSQGGPKCSLHFAIHQKTNCRDYTEQIRQSPENSGLAWTGISFDNPMYRT